MDCRPGPGSPLGLSRPGPPRPRAGWWAGAPHTRKRGRNAMAVAGFGRSVRVFFAGAVAAAHPGARSGLGGPRPDPGSGLRAPWRAGAPHARKRGRNATAAAGFGGSVRVFFAWARPPGQKPATPVGPGRAERAREGHAQHRFGHEYDAVLAPAPGCGLTAGGHGHEPVPGRCLPAKGRGGPEKGEPWKPSPSGRVDSPCDARGSCTSTRPSRATTSLPSRAST